MSDPPWNGGFFVEEDILLLAATSKGKAFTSCRRRICKEQSSLPPALNERKNKSEALIPRALVQSPSCVTHGHYAYAAYKQAFALQAHLMRFPALRAHYAPWYHTQRIRCICESPHNAASEHFLLKQRAKPFERSKKSILGLRWPNTHEKPENTSFGLKQAK